MYDIANEIAASHPDRAAELRRDAAPIVYAHIDRLSGFPDHASRAAALAWAARHLAVTEPALAAELIGQAVSFATAQTPAR